MTKKITPSIHSHEFVINIDSLDTDNDGKINQDEFVIAAIGMETLFNLNMLKAGFNSIARQPGYFTMDDLKAFVADKYTGTEQNWNSLKILFDPNNDAKIEFKELVEGLRLRYD